MSVALCLARIVAVVTLLGLAAAIATPKGRLPLALRGVRRLMREDAGQAASDPRDAGACVSPLRRFAAFVLVLAAVALALC